MKWLAFVALFLALTVSGVGVGWGCLAAGGWYAWSVGK